jgi:hypothetical protein
MSARTVEIVPAIINDDATFHPSSIRADCRSAPAIRGSIPLRLWWFINTTSSSHAGRGRSWPQHRRGFLSQLFALKEGCGWHQPKIGPVKAPLESCIALEPIQTFDHPFTNHKTPKIPSLDLRRIARKIRREQIARDNRLRPVT